MTNVQKFWRQRGTANILLLPAAALFAAAATLRRHWLLRRQHKAPPLPPVIIVGNIVAGGSGKTPIVIALAESLAQRGWRPGIVSRGHGGSVGDDILLVEDDTDWRRCGDEALLIRRRSGQPVCVSRRRPLAAKRLADAGCDIIISDDGMQHYALPRAAEICVFDASYGIGNGWPLPAGPLREGVARARQCTLRLRVENIGGASNNDNTPHIADNMITVQKQVRGCHALAAPRQLLPPNHFANRKITALAGIARPTDFFQTLTAHGIAIADTIALPDHAAAETLRGDTIIMTEKDAVKYPPTDSRLHALAIDCPLPQSVIDAVENAAQNRRA